MESSVTPFIIIAYFNAGKSIHPHLLSLPVVAPNSLPEKAKTYIEFIEKFTDCSASIISTGPSRNQTISRYVLAFSGNSEY
jgi:hypothetical protein